MRFTSRHLSWFFSCRDHFLPGNTSSRPRTAERGRASLDNCQIELNEAGKSWDSGNWAVKLFEFPLSSCNGTDDALNREARPEINGRDGHQAGLDNITTEKIDPLSDISRQNFLASFDSSTRLGVNFSAEFGDLMLILNYWLPAVEDVQGFPW